MIMILGDLLLRRNNFAKIIIKCAPSNMILEKIKIILIYFSINGEYFLTASKLKGQTKWSFTFCEDTIS